MENLYAVKLGIPQEEVLSIRATLKKLHEKTTILKETKENKKDHYEKYCEECQKSKEARELELKTMKEIINNEKATREQIIYDAKEAGVEDEKQLDDEHQKICGEYQKKVEKLEKDLLAVKKTSMTEEANLRKEFKKTSNDLISYTQ